MTDKYQKLRNDLAAALADAERQGGVNERAERIAALLAERDTLAAAPVSAEPLFWYRPRSDDGYEGPLHNSRVGDVRKASGAWVPLFAGTAPVSSADGLPDFPPNIAPTDDWDDVLEEVKAYGLACYKAALAQQANGHIQWVQRPDITDAPDDVLTDRGKQIRAAQRDADKLDAERYRWMRQNWGRIDEIYEGGTGRIIEIHVSADADGWDTDPDSLDTAIDAARKEAGHGE